MYSKIQVIGISLFLMTYPAIAFSLTSEEARLTKLAYDYLVFVHDVGNAKSVQQNDTRLYTLFAQDLTKIDNGSILFENNRQALLPQMKGFEKEYNPESNKADWVIHRENALIITSVQTNSVVVHFEWTHINVGKGITTAILQSNANNQIQRIIDVWALVKSN